MALPAKVVAHLAYWFLYTEPKAKGLQDDVPYKLHALTLIKRLISRTPCVILAGA